MSSEVKIMPAKFNREYERLKTIGFIQVIFILLKLSGQVTWSWGAVLLPVALKIIYEVVFLIMFIGIQSKDEKVNRD